MKDLSDIMRQAQDMQKRLQEAQAKMEELTAEGSSGGGMVKVTLKGKGEIHACRCAAQAGRCDGRGDEERDRRTGRDVARVQAAVLIFPSMRLWFWIVIPAEAKRRAGSH